MLEGVKYVYAEIYKTALHRPLMSFAQTAFGGLAVSQWYHGWWDCNIDGRPAKMVWQVVNDSRTTCNGNVCSTTSGVKTIGWFSDNRSPWVRLGINYTIGDRLGIRYLGSEPDNWELTFNASTLTANGWTTWRGNRYPLMCWNRLR